MNNASPCMTCALRVTVPLSDPITAAHAHAVFLQFKRHYPKSFRVHDMTGPKEENTTWFCVLGDRHFNKDNVKCPKWIPKLDITVSDAINLNLNRTMLLLTRIMLALAVIGLLNLVEPLGNLFKKENPQTPRITNSSTHQPDKTGNEKQNEAPKQNELPQNQ